MTWRFALAVWLLIAPHSARAFTLYENDAGQSLHWAAPASLTIVTRDAPFAEGELRDVVQKSFAAWAAVDASVPAHRVGDVAADPAPTPDAGLHEIQFKAHDWAYGKTALAVTVFSYKKSSGELVDADIYVNSDEHCFTTAGDKNCYDLQAVLTHEAGHFLGLDHNNDDEAAVMYPSEAPNDTNKRALTLDDKAGVFAAYQSLAVAQTPAADPVSGSVPASSANKVARTEPSLGCGQTQGTLPAVFAVVIWTVLRRRRAARAAMAAALALLATPVANAAAIARGAEDGLAESEIVFTGVPIAENAYVDPALNMVVTEHTIFVRECLRGVCDALVVFRTLGGEVGDLVTRVPGEATVSAGAEQLFFAARATQVGPARETRPLLQGVIFGRGVAHKTLQNGQIYWNLGSRGSRKYSLTTPDIQDWLSSLASSTGR